MNCDNTGKFSAGVISQQVTAFIQVHDIHAIFNRICQAYYGQIHGHYLIYRSGVAGASLQNNIPAVIPLTENALIFISLHYYQVAKVYRIQHVQGMNYQGARADYIKGLWFTVQYILN